MLQLTMRAVFLCALLFFLFRAVPSQVFRRLGVHTSHVIPGTTQHWEELKLIDQQKREAKRQAAGEQNSSSEDEQ